MNTLAVVSVFVMVALSIAAVKTAIPNLGARKPCLLGYRATCSFTPVSTAILAVVAVIVFFAARQVHLL